MRPVRRYAAVDTDSPMPVRAYTPEGRRAPAYCTSTGKALLAHQPMEVIERVAAAMEPHTGMTMASRKALLAELEKVRAAGYSMNRGEWNDYVRGVAAPVFGPEGEVVAALSVTGPSAQVREDRIGPAVRLAAAGASRAYSTRRWASPKK